MSKPSHIFATLPAVRLPGLSSVQLPLTARVHLEQADAPAVPDVPALVAAQLRTSTRLAALPQGASTAVAVGSRGIADIAVVVRATVDYLHARGFKPFIVPGMGSHGGGSAAGQRDVLAALGITARSMNAPIRSSMETVALGQTAAGIACRFDKNAAEADAIIVINRVKSHTSFDRTQESGLIKMLAVGLGKAEGAVNVHRLGAPGLRDVLPEMATIALKKAPVAYGLALIENKGKALAHIEGVEPENFFSREAVLLQLAKGLLPRLPFAQLDALIIDRVGKDISGIGMDYVVTGRTDIRGIPNPEHIRVTKLGTLRLTPASRGNGMGAGLADFSTLALVNSLDLRATYRNAFTSTFAEKGKLPMALPTERDVIRACLASCWVKDSREARFCLIRSTLELDDVLVSPPLLKELQEKNPDLRAVSRFSRLRFSKDGTLLTRP